LGTKGPIDGIIINHVEKPSENQRLEDMRLFDE